MFPLPVRYGRGCLQVPSTVADGQNSARNMNSIRRGAPVPVAPVLRIPVMRPKLADGLMLRFDPLPETDPTLAPGVCIPDGSSGYCS